MTLKEKFSNIELDDPYIFMQESNVIECEKIADDYAIEFAEWLETDWTCDERWTIIVDKKELLEIFKKEKGL